MRLTDKELDAISGALALSLAGERDDESEVMESAQKKVWKEMARRERLPPKGKRQKRVKFGNYEYSFTCSECPEAVHYSDCLAMHDAETRAGTDGWICVNVDGFERWLCPRHA